MFLSPNGLFSILFYDGQMAHCYLEGKINEKIEKNDFKPEWAIFDEKIEKAALQQIIKCSFAVLAFVLCFFEMFAQSFCVVASVRVFTQTMKCLF